MQVYSSNYRYNGADRLDVTMKTNNSLGKALNPGSWDLVMGYKNGKISEEQYIEKYIKRLNEAHPIVWDELGKYSRVTLVCFCRPGDFCHRVLLAKYLEEKLGANYRGEI